MKVLGSKFHLWLSGRWTAVIDAGIKIILTFSKDTNWHKMFHFSVSTAVSVLHTEYRTQEKYYSRTVSGNYNYCDHGKGNKGNRLRPKPAVCTPWAGWHQLVGMEPYKVNAPLKSLSWWSGDFEDFYGELSHLQSDLLAKEVIQSCRGGFKLVPFTFIGVIRITFVKDLGRRANGFSTISCTSL